MKRAHGTSFGKIILLGEHSVVYYEPAIAIPFEGAKIYVIITPTTGDITIKCFNYTGCLNEAPVNLLGLKTVIEATLKKLNVKQQDLAIDIVSSIPAERGMGSSAAVSNATIRAIYAYFDQEVSEAELLELVDISEKIVHGNPSGLDASIVVKNETLYYTKGEPFEPFHLDLDAVLIVADTGLKGNTKIAVERVAKKYADDDSTKTMIQELGNFAKDGRGAIEATDAHRLGTLMYQAQSHLKALGVSNLTIDNLVDTAMSNGALGAKLTGGGLGGCMIALANDQESADKIASALKSAGAMNTWTMHLKA